MKKQITALILFSILSISGCFSQIFVDNQGNVYDQRKGNNVKSNDNTQYVNQTSKKSSFDASKLEFGGDLGLQFGRYTFISVSPQVGYRFSNMFTAGAGIGYSYYSDDDYYYDYTEHTVSMNLYANFYPVNFIILSVRPEVSRLWMNTEDKSSRGEYSDNKFVPSVVVGGGVRLGAATIQIKYDIVQDDYSPYGNNLFYSVGYTFGF